MRKIRQALCLLLTCALLLGALPATATAAGDDWRELTLTSGDCDIHLSKIRTEKMTIRADVAEDELNPPELSVTAIIMAQGCEINACFNETVTQVDPSEAEYLLEEFQVDSLEALIGVECWAFVDILYWLESDQGYVLNVAYSLPNGTVTESWHEDRCHGGIPSLTLMENGVSNTYIFVAENYPVHGERQQADVYQVVGGNIYFDNATGTITGADTSVTSATIPAEIDGVAVKEIGYGAFEDCKSLTSVAIPDGVTTIGDFAFYGCESLASIDISDSVATIGDYAFAYCASLESVTIPDSVTTIGDYAFQMCYSLTSVTIPDGVATIGDYAFAYCASLTGIDIPDSVTTIGNWVFFDCESLTSVTIPHSVTGIGYGTFSGCDNLTAITVDSENPSYTSADGVLFSKDMTLLHSYPKGHGTTYVIPDSVTTVGSYAFQSCDSLTSVTIPNGVTTIEDWVFVNCVSLTGIDIPDSVTTIGFDAFSGCESLTSVTIPRGVTGIGSGAFSSCNNLTSITVDSENPSYTSADGVLFSKDMTLLHSYPNGHGTSYAIPDSVATIGDDAFSWCDSLTSVTIPDSVTTIGDSAFYYCTSLTDIYFGGTEEQWKENGGINSGYDANKVTVHYNNSGSSGSGGSGGSGGGGGGGSVGGGGSGSGGAGGGGASGTPNTPSVPDTSTNQTWSNPFADVSKTDWFYDAVSYVVENGMMNGSSETAFNPNSVTTRAMVMTILYRLEGEPTVTEDIPFTDVPAGQWYSDAINWATANNIVGGYGNDRFGLNDTITREQMAAILYRYAEYKGYDTTNLADLTGYADAGKVSDWALTAMQWAVGENIINGTSATTLSSSGDSTRAQVAAIFMRFCEGSAK